MKFNVYYSKARGAFFAKWKENQRWQLKAIPKSIQEEAAAIEWARHHLNGQPQKPINILPPAPVDIRVTFRQASMRWLERKELIGDPKLTSGCRSFASRWLGSLADTAIEDCGLKHATLWVEWVKKETRSHYTARNIVSTMRGMIVEARGMQWVELKENVFLDPWIKKLMAEGAPSNVPIVRLEKHQLLKLLSCKQVPPDRRFRYAFASSTAMRLGELGGLKYRDVRNGIVDVQRQVTNGTTKPPKRGSVRLIPLHPILENVFRTNVGSGTMVFGTDQGNWSRTLREDLAVAGVSPRHRSGASFTFHALRRTGLTIMRASGMPLEDVKAVAGHCGKSITERHYAEADLRRLQEMITAAFDELLREAAQAELRLPAVRHQMISPQAMLPA